MIKNLGQKNEGIESFWSYFDHLKAVPPRVNCSMTCLGKMYNVYEQKNEMIKNLGQKNEGIESFWYFHHPKAVPPRVNYSMTCLVKMYKVYEQKNEMNRQEKISEKLI
ncbi:MAG: hypothetical protein GY694_00200 [Gammaproteobacteria bacterium]|nr:hypothetical protein [Gammaproteobacteria bacterium]